MQSVKQKLAWLWGNAERILVILLFATFTLNIRKVFLTPYSVLNGGFNEYAAISVSWADVLALAIIIIYTTKQILSQVINPYYASSSSKKSFFEKLLNNVSRETIFLLLLLLWSGLSIFWSLYKPISLFRFAQWVEIVFLGAIMIKLFKKNLEWIRIAILAFIASGLFQSILGIVQFIHNGSLGLHFLGESIIGPNIDGVAKIIINGEKHIRAYGTLPHPNILAGFLVIPLFILVGEILGRSASRETILSRMSPRLLWVALLIVVSGFILTFSRSAFLGLFVGLIFFCFWGRKTLGLSIPSFLKGGLGGVLFSMRPKNPSPALPLIKGESRKWKLFVFSSFSLLLLAFLLNNTSFFSNQSLDERKLYSEVSYETISSRPIEGVGMGQFVLSEYQKFPDLQGWQYQPVHNFYLLVFSELGIIGLAIFLLALSSFLTRKVRNTDLLRLTKIVIRCIIISFIFISLFDHYFWDIKPGQIIFVLPIILIAAMRNNSAEIQA